MGKWAALTLVAACTSGAGAVMASLPEIPPKEAVSRRGPIARGGDAAAKSFAGTRAPELPKLEWLDGVSRDLDSLRGRVVVIRSYTNACPFCAASMPALEQLHEDFEDRGLTVLGVYHPKPPRPTSPADVAELSKSLGVSFPVAIDIDWKLVKGWWLDRGAETWTSVTWILDRDGTVRYVHPGGEYHDGGGPDHERCRQDMREIRRVIERLLAEPITGPRRQ